MWGEPIPRTTVWFIWQTVREIYEADRIDCALRTKQDGKGPQVLELAVDPRHWQMLAEHVEAVDALDRPVTKHARWTVNTAPRLLTDRRRIR